MNYRHIFHAGNFADVFKHLLLITLVERLQQKTKPFCYLDTHAGIGIYDLTSIFAQKTQEYRSGIAKIWELSELPPAGAHYLELIKDYNREQGYSQLRYYLGSPYLVKKMLRPNDRMILAELHHQDILSLKKNFCRDKQVAVHHLDGYQALKAFLPPKEKRGLVLMDPPFEAAAEFGFLIEQLQCVMHKWSQGIYAVWYPIKQSNKVQEFYRQLKLIGAQEIGVCEFKIQNINDVVLTACGMVVVHPPWQWMQSTEHLLSWLCKTLGSSETQANYRVEVI